MRIAVIHPLKHHAFFVAEGLLKYSSDSVVAYFGYYNRNDIIDRLLLHTPLRNIVEGYKNQTITDIVSTNYCVKMCFLLYKLIPNKLESWYLGKYQSWCIKQIKKDKIECIYVLQDYCNDVIKFAKENNIRIIYDQIIAFNYEKYIRPKDNGISNDKCFSTKLCKQVRNLKWSDIIVAPSNFVIDSLAGYSFSKEIVDKVRLIHYGGDCKKYHFKERKYIPGEKLRLLFVGSITYRKGIDKLIQAFSLISRPDIELTIVGSDGYEESSDILNLIEDDSRIKYIGTIPHEKMSDVYEKAHFFILPSFAEGSSLSVFEALASGLPCIVTKNVGSTITDGVEGLILEECTINSIKNTIISLFGILDNIRKMSIAANENAKQYSWEYFSKNLIREIKSLEKHK